MSGKESGTQMNQTHPQSLLREGFEDEGSTRATASFPGSLTLPLAPGGKTRDPGNEVVRAVV